MTQEQKDLLLKDLYARLPHGVKVEAKGLLKVIVDDYDNRGIINAHVLNGLNLKDQFKTYSIDCMGKVPLFNRKGLFNIKPYLFPLSSMTEEIMDEIYNNVGVYDIGIDSPVHIEVGTTFEDLTKIIDILHKYHIDYRGLIPMGLALDATGLKIY